MLGGETRCDWRWEWSYQNPGMGATFPPRSPSCLIHQSDSVRLVNSGKESRTLARVCASAAPSCDASQPLEQLSVIPPNTSLPLNLSRVLQVSEEVHLVSDQKNGSCLHASFSLTNRTLSSCERPPCVSQGPCFRLLPLPLRSADCQLSLGDWVRVVNADSWPRSLTAFNRSWTVPPAADLLLPTGNSSFPLNDSTTRISVSVLAQNQLTCSHLCSPMSATSLLNPLAVSLVSLLILLAALSVLLALCLRKGRAISSEECPPPPGETTGKYEMKSGGKMARDAEVKIREKKPSTSATSAVQAAPPDTEPAPAKEARVIEKRSSQFAELLSKFN